MGLGNLLCPILSRSYCHNPWLEEKEEEDPNTGLTGKRRTDEETVTLLKGSNQRHYQGQEKQDRNYELMTKHMSGVDN